MKTILKSKTKKIFPVLFLSLVLLVFSSLYIEAAEGFKIKNPLKWETLQELADAVFAGLVKISFLIAPLIIVIAGYLFLTAGGDPQKVSTAKKMIMYTITGLIVLLASYGIIKIIVQFFKKG
jgi:hypothetical protein